MYITVSQRNKIPNSVSSLASSKAAITSQSDWGTPTASYPGGSNCDVSKAFTPQNMVIDITLCGVWYIDTFLSPLNHSRLYIGEGTLSFTSPNAAPGDQLREKLPA
jgi:hypothetical protein